MTVLTFEIIGHWMQDFFNRTEEINKRIEYANEQFEVERVQKMYEESRKLRHDLKHMLIENTVIIERSIIFSMIRMINVKSRI